MSERGEKKGFGLFLDFLMPGSFTTCRNFSVQDFEIRNYFVKQL
jgi:hypothetical protein